VKNGATFLCGGFLVATNLVPAQRLKKCSGCHGLKPKGLEGAPAIVETLTSDVRLESAASYKL